MAATRPESIMLFASGLRKASLIDKLENEMVGQ